MPWYHVMHRAPHRADPASLAPSGVEVLAYCRMGTHDHLLLAAAALPALGHSRALEIRTACQMLLASRYIHRNPVVAGLCRRPEDWVESSYRAYLGSAPRPAWLEIRPILD